MRRAVALLLPILLVGCGSTDNVEASTTCVDQPFRAALHVDDRDPRKVWATDFETGLDVAVRPRPPDRFTIEPDRPDTILNASGEVFSFTGEITRSGCLDPVNEILYLGPTDVPDPNRGSN